MIMINKTKMEIACLIVNKEKRQMNFYHKIHLKMTKISSN